MPSSHDKKEFDRIRGPASRASPTEDSKSAPSSGLQSKRPSKSRRVPKDVSTLDRYAALYQGDMDHFPESALRVRALPGVLVLDESRPLMALLVAGRKEQLESTFAAMPEWTLTPEQMLPMGSAQSH